MPETTVPDTTPPKPRARGAWLSLGALLAVVALAFGINVLADRFLARARIDLTQQHLYTLSDGTKAVVSNLRDPVTLRLFYSRRLGAAVPVFGAYADRVRDMLREYVLLSNGRIRLEILDPEPFSETEDRALAYGLQGVPLDNAGEQVYFGLAGVNLLDDERSVAFFQPDRERFLEYDLTRLVNDLSNPARPALGVLSSLPLNGDPRAMMMRVPGAGQPFQVMTQLRQFFTIKDIAPDAQAIPPDIQVLLVAHAQNLPDAALYAIDQFVLRGGRLMALTDPHSESQAARPDPSGRPAASTASNLDRLFTAWGIEAPADKVVVDQRGAWRVRAGPNDRVGAVDYLAWFNAQGDSLNRSDVATADLSQVTFASAGEVRRRDGAATEFTPLVTASAQSALIDAARVREPDPARVLTEFRADGARHVLLARIRGTLATAFPEGPPPLPEGTERVPGLPAHLAASSGPVNLVVGNDTDLLEDRFWVRSQDFFGQQVATPTSDNGALVTNLADTLAGGDNLISLRSRGESLRPFTLVDAMRADADARYRQTERALTERLQVTERRLRELRQGPGGAAQGAAQTVITPEQRAEIDAARAEIVRTRQELRGVQRGLRQGIENLETWLRLVNIALVPALITAFAIGLALLRGRRRAAARG